VAGSHKGCPYKDQAVSEKGHAPARIVPYFPWGGIQRASGYNISLGNLRESLRRYDDAQTYPLNSQSDRTKMKKYRKALDKSSYCGILKLNAVDMARDAEASRVMSPGPVPMWAVPSPVRRMAGERPPVQPLAAFFHDNLADAASLRRASGWGYAMETLFMPSPAHRPSLREDSTPLGGKGRAMRSPEMPTRPMLRICIGCATLSNIAQLWGGADGKRRNRRPERRRPKRSGGRIELDNRYAHVYIMVGSRNSRPGKPRHRVAAQQGPWADGRANGRRRSTTES